MKSNLKIFLLCTVSAVLLTIGFNHNQWNIVDSKKFATYQKNCINLITGRIAESHSNGFFSQGSLLRENDQNNNKYKAYKSQNGGQGLLFSILNQWLGYSQSHFYLITSILSAITLSFILLWFYIEFGTSLALCVLFSMVFSQWMTLFGSNYFWCLWAFYIPFLASLYCLQTEKKATRNKNLRITLLIYSAVFVKCFINGYDFMTPTLVMILVPFIYYAILHQWGFRQLSKRILFALLSAGLAILTSFILLCIQIYFYTGNLSAGINHILYTIGKRTWGNSAHFPTVYKKSLESDLPSLLLKYLNGTYLHYGYLDIRYWHLIILFLIVSLLLIFLKQAHNKRQITALVTATWFSALAPLSWLTIFKAHAHSHTHLDFIVWHMPFMLFGFALCGLLIRILLNTGVLLKK